MAAPARVPVVVELGFAARPAAATWRLRADHFASRVGGRPAWLGREPLPRLPEQLACGRCASTAAFLLQVYAPLPGRDDCFHRSLLLFCCRDPACYAEPHDSRCLRVVRCQLPRSNPFYSFDPPPPPPPAPDGPRADVCAESEKAGDAWSSSRLCRVCGGPGPKACSRCHAAAYCGKQHQAMDWKAGHKSECGHLDKQPVPNRDHGFLFPEYEILTEAEEDEDDDDEEEGEQVEEDATSDAASQDALKTTTENTLDEEQLEAMARKESADDRAFRLFKEKIARDPTQVLRYSRDGQPLWVSSEHVATASDIPACTCGSARTFEFQVMPQLLSELHVDSLGASIDWGTLVVYTCSQSCSPPDGPYAYASEFVWKQDFVHSATGLRQPPN